MPWKIVNLDYATRPHLHIKDPNAPIHLRAFFADQRVEIGLGAEEPEECFVRATVTPDEVVVQAIEFEPMHVQILASILASLDVDPDERDDALAWMREKLPPGTRAGVPVARGERGERGAPVERIRGNVASFPPPTGWPYDLADDALLDSLADREGTPHTRVSALLREAQRRGLRASSRAMSHAPGPEVMRRRPPGR